MNGDHTCIHDAILIVFLMKHTLHGVIGCTLKVQQQEEGEYLLVSQGHFILTLTLGAD